MALVYSCCFWFSLRLGGILIGLFSLGIINLICGCLAYTYTEEVKDELQEWYNNWDFIFSKEYLETLMEDPRKYISAVIGISCVYIVSCIMYIYGAFNCNNLLMFAFIGIEFVRLIFVSLLMATALLLIKQNTMDIGFLIGASVVVGFYLLGMFYLWLCAANLPVLITEMEQDEQAATIAKLQRLLETSRSSPRDHHYGTYGMPEHVVRRGVFVVRKHRGFDTELMNNYKIPDM